MSVTKILYVEDDTDYADLIRQQLAAKDFEVAIAPTASKAEKLFREFRPALVLVDLDLQQEKEGLEVIRTIYRLSPRFPVMVYSAHAEPETLIQTMALGVLHHVDKEKSLPELVAMIHNALKRTYFATEQNNPVYQLSTETTYNTSTYILTTGETTIPLNRTAGLLLKQLCLHINEFVQSDELLLAVWGYKKNIVELRRYASRLRKIFTQYDPSIRVLNLNGGNYQLECDLWKNDETKE